MDDYNGKDNKEPIIIKEFKINNKLLKNKEEDNASENSYEKYCYYTSDENHIRFRLQFKETFSVCESTCESNEKVDYFKLNFCSFITLFFELGSTYYYEIILNGNSIKFSNENFKYQIIDDKIIFEGFLDEYDEKKYIELAKKKIIQNIILNFLIKKNSWSGNI